MNHIAEDILKHYGMPRRSGRYPWGSGKDPYQHSGDFLSRVNDLKEQGLSEKQIADAIGLTTTNLRIQLRTANHERRELDVDRARSLRDDGKSLNEIADIMGFNNDSSVRSLLNENTAKNKNQARTTADILKKEMETKDMVDVGVGVERVIGVSPNTLQEALFILETEGYNVYQARLPQVTNPGKKTTIQVLANADVPYKDVYQNTEGIKSVRDYHSTDGGTTFDKREYPASIDSKRVNIRYGDEGGSNKDGVIELRRGVDDLSLGNSNYAQVRILVDGSRYLKGMAMYSDNVPDGYDIVFNTNKKSDVDKMKVLKPITEDPDNPFGAYIKAQGQSFYDDPNGKYVDAATGKKQSLSVINKLKEEGDWDEMSKNLSSQFLSKQPMALIKKQLNLTYADAEAKYDEIRSLNNPTVKKKMLLDFADECDGAVVHLKSAALPGQKTQVILPITSLSDTEVYAPNFDNGKQVALVRYPHGGTFEIPVLTVNNKHREARKILGADITDAIGINPTVAKLLSGADFDGDQVVVIPLSDKVRIKSTPVFENLIKFDAKDSYPSHPGMKLMTAAGTQKQMGSISNLITDMTLKGATNEEMVRAVKHSMVVIDAAKHELNYKQSEKDNGIAALKKKYQGYVDDDGKEVGGASTLISRKKQDIRVPERQGSGIIDATTGRITYKESGRVYTDPKTGEIVPSTTKVKLLNEVDDVRTLSSGTPQENAYADYANKMKALANQARKEHKTTGNIKYSSSAATTYQREVTHLDAQLRLAEMNAPRERRAQAIANSVVKAKIQAHPELEKDKKAIRKISQLAIHDARASVNASGKDTRITINDAEWEAIQSGAISDTKLSRILKYTDPDVIAQRATPRTTNQLSSTQINKIKTMRASGYSNAEIAKSLGVSTSTVAKYFNN